MKIGSFRAFCMDVCVGLTAGVQRLLVRRNRMRGLTPSWLAAIALTLASTIAQAAEQRFTVYVDADSNAATGCTIATVAGARSGVEAAFTAVVDTRSTPFRTVRLEQQNCVAGALASPTVYDASTIATESAGTYTGVTLWIPQAVFPAPTAQAFVGSVSSAGDRDVTVNFQIVARDSASVQSVAVPLSPWLVLVIAVSVAGLALRAGRARQWLGVVCAVVFVGFAASAIAVVVNGVNISWLGRAAALVDAADANPNAEVSAIYVQNDANAVYVRVDADLRIDAGGSGNTAPVISGLPATATLAWPAAPLALAATVTDDGLPNPPAALTLSWTTVSGPGTVTFSPANAASTSATFSAAGLYVIRLTASDGALPSTQDIAVTVNTASTGNAAPVISNLPSTATVNLPTNTLALTPTVADDGLPNPPAALTYAWTQISGPTAGAGGVFPVSFSASTTKDTTVSFDLAGAGNYVLRLTVSDGASSSARDIAVTVNPVASGAPTISALNDRSVKVGETLRFVLAANDPNYQQLLSYNLVASPTGAGLSGTGNAVFTFTPTKAQVGAHPVTVNVADNSAPTPLSTQRGFNINVVDANLPPKFTAQSKVDGVVASGGTFTRALTATDPDAGDTLTFSLVDGPSGMTVSPAGALSWVSGATANLRSVIVRVSDSAGNADFARFNIAIQASAPPVAIDDSYRVQVGSTLTVPAAQGVLANDVDPAGLPLTATKQTNPSKGAVSAFNPDGSFSYDAPALPAPNAFNPTLVKQQQISPTYGAFNWQLADVNGDGAADIVFTSACTYGGNCISAFDIKNGVLLWETNGAADGCTVGFSGTFGQHLAIADIDDDGVPDVVVVGHCSVLNTPFNRILAFNARTGALKWRSDEVAAPGTVFQDPVPLAAYAQPLTIARLRTGEKPSILLGVVASGARYSGNFVDPVASCSAIVKTVPDGNFQADPAKPTLHYQSCAGVIILSGESGVISQRLIQDAGTQTLLELGKGRNCCKLETGALVADLDGSGQNKIMMSGAIWNLDGSKFGNSTPSLTWDAALGNFDDTPDIEFASIHLRPDLIAELVLRKADGRVLWRLPLPVTTPGHISVADLDGDGKADILINVRNALWAVDHRGRIRWTHAMPCLGDCAAGGGWDSRAAVFDLDGDGVPEVIVTYNNELRLLDGRTGALKASRPTLTTGLPSGFWSYDELPRVIDVDGDGHADVVILSTTDIRRGTRPNVMVFSDAANQWRPTRKIDNQFAYFGANVNDDGTIPSTVPLPNNFATVAGNVFGSQPQILAPVDPRLRDQTRFTYTASNGALSSSPATVTITIDPPNRPPKFTSTPPTRHNGTLNYQAVAVDPDVGDTLTYALETQMVFSGVPCTIVATTGMVTCSRLQSNFLDELLVISVTDSFGAKAVQSVVVQYSAANCTVPDVAGQTQAAASAALVAAGCTLGDVSESNAATPSGRVISQSPLAASVILGGEAVSLVVSKGPAPVAVPLVVGLSESIAKTRLQNAGFGASVTRLFSNSIRIGEVVSQSVAAGSAIVPGVAPVGLIVSAGTGLTVRLDRSLATADQTITVIPEAFDVNGAPATLPSLTYSVVESITGFGAPLPTISGTTITASALTFGAYRVTATDSAGGRSASADFVIGNTPAVDESTHLQSYATMTDALEAIYALRPALVAARAANDVPLMTNLLRQIVSTWRGFDLEDVKLSMSIAPVDKFPLSVAEMRALGLSPTASDLVVNSILKDAVMDLRAWTAALRADGDTLAQLDALADQFNTRAARLNGLTISEFGGILNEKEYTLLLSHALPDFYEAFFNEIGRTVGLAPRVPQFKGLGKAPSQTDYAKSTLAEQLVTIAVDKVVEKVMEQANERVKNAKQFAVDIMGQAQWTAAAIAVTAHLKEFVLGRDIEAVISGASYSFRVFNKPTPNWATIEVLGDFDEPQLSSVMMIGPDTINDVSNEVKSTYDKIKEAVSFGINPINNPKKYKNRNQQNKFVKQLKKKIAGAQGAANALQNTIANTYSYPDQVLRGCVFSSDPSCSQLYYEDGFDPVYRYNPPSGFSGFSGLPVPIIFIVQNQLTGEMFFGTPVFLPAPKVD